MAASKSYFTRANYRFLDVSSGMSSDAMFELDESDVWTTARSASPEFRKPAASSRMSSSKKKYSSSGGKVDRGGGGGGTTVASSLPVKVPDWSKILKDEYRENRRSNSEDDDFDDEDGEDGGGNRIPPHEFLAIKLARTRIASFSVHEGVGRTLKGRDLNRVRNAIWEKIGYQD